MLADAGAPAAQVLTALAAALPGGAAPTPGSFPPPYAWRGAARRPTPRTSWAGPPAPCTAAASPRSATGRPVLRRVLRFRRAVALLQAGVDPGRGRRPRRLRRPAAPVPRRIRALAAGLPGPSHPGGPSHRRGRRPSGCDAGAAAQPAAAPPGSGRTGRRRCRPGRGPSRSAAPRTRRTAPARCWCPATVSCAYASSTAAGSGSANARPTRPAPGAAFHAGWKLAIVASVSNASRSPPGRATSTCGCVVGLRGDVQAQQPVEGERALHVGDDHAHHGQFRVCDHAVTLRPAPPPVS